MLAAALVLGSCGERGSTSEEYYSTEVIFPNGKKVLAESIRDPITMQRGMMFRDKLDAGRGMLFTHGQAGNFAYWMHNVKMPLDIIWLDAQRDIVEIVESAAPCPRKPCPSIGGNKPALFVLEVNGGVARENNLKPGDRLKLVGF